MTRHFLDGFIDNLITRDCKKRHPSKHPAMNELKETFRSLNFKVDESLNAKHDADCARMSKNFIKELREQYGSKL